MIEHVHNTGVRCGVGGGPGRFGVCLEDLDVSGLSKIDASGTGLEEESDIMDFSADAGAGVDTADKWPSSPDWSEYKGEFVIGESNISESESASLSSACAACKRLCCGVAGLKLARLGMVGRDGKPSRVSLVPLIQLLPVSFRNNDVDTVSR